MPSVNDQIAELEAKIRELRSSQVEELREKLREAKKVVADLEAQMAQISGEPAPAGATVRPARRKRMSSEEIKGAILKALASTEEGMSQKEISDVTGIGYQTVLKFFKENAKNFKTTGAARSKRFFLK